MCGLSAKINTVDQQVRLVAAVRSKVCKENSEVVVGDLFNFCLRLFPTPVFFLILWRVCSVSFKFH